MEMQSDDSDYLYNNGIQNNSVVWLTHLSLVAVSVLLAWLLPSALSRSVLCSTMGERQVAGPTQAPASSDTNCGIHIS